MYAGQLEHFASGVKFTNINSPCCIFDDEETELTFTRKQKALYKTFLWTGKTLRKKATRKGSSS